MKHLGGTDGGKTVGGSHGDKEMSGFVVAVVSESPIQMWAVVVAGICVLFALLLSTLFLPGHPSTYNDPEKHLRSPNVSRNEGPWIGGWTNSPWLKEELAAASQGGAQSANGLAMSKKSELFQEPSQSSDKRPDKPGADFKHKDTKETLWIEGWLDPHCVHLELLATVRGPAQCGDGCNSEVYHGAAGRDYKWRMAMLNWTQLIETHNSLPILFKRGQREGINKNSSGTCENMRTLCKAGQLKEALHILNQRCVWADSTTYFYLLQECIKMQGLAEGKQVHAHIMRSGFKPNVFLFNTLVNMYVKCGRLVDAQEVFEKMPERDLFTWNILIAGYAKHGLGREALGIYEKMIRERVMPNKITFICVLNACGGLIALEKGKAVHADIGKARVVPDIVLDTALVSMYAKCGSIKDAREVFNNMAQQNVVSWNAIIAGYAKHRFGMEALEIYEQMIGEGVMPNKVTFTCVLNACASLVDLVKGKELHADIRKAGIGSDAILENALIDMYAKCGSMKDACRVFDHMSHRNVVSWSVMIAGYAQHGYGREALESYEQMIREGVTPDKVTFTCVVNACASLGVLQKGKEVHAFITKTRIAPDVILVTALVAMYAKCGSMKDAHLLFDNMAQRNLVAWSAMIAGYVQHGCSRKAVKIYEQMRREGVMPNKVIFTCILNACASLAALEKGKEVHEDIMEGRIEPDIILVNSLVNMYAKCSSIKDARQVFNNMTVRDVVSWNTIIAGYSQLCCGLEAFEIYRQMIWEGVAPDKVTFICLLNACANLAALEKGMEVHADIVKAGIPRDIILENALVDMYAKCGSVKDARQVLNNMAQRDVVSWNAMIAGYGQHGCAMETLQLFEEMQQEGLKPDCITFVSLLSACSHVGLVDEGCHFFDSMSQDHGLTPTVEHFSCMVDLLGRAGQLDEAEDFISEMPMEPGDAVWRALLGACRVHGDVERAEYVAKCLLELDPQDSSTYVLLSNIYAAAGRWDDQVKVTKMMKARGVMKEPGNSCIEIDHQVHIFEN